MLDRVLGRAALKDRIAELEEEKHHLERRLDAEQERRADAVSARQDAEERVNRLEDRIAELEGRVEASETADGSADLAFRREERVRGERRAAVLDRLESVETGPEGALSAMVTDEGGVPDPVRDLLGDHAALVDRAAPCLVYADDAGLVCAALRPPLAPDPFCEWSDGFRVDRSWFAPDADAHDADDARAGVREYALAVVRADTFALGRYEGRDRVDFEGFRSDVKEQHSKGGFSQARFERIRDEQIDAHIEKCHDALADVDVPLYVVGERGVLGEFAERAAVTRTADATGKPEAALESAWREFWTTRVYGL